MRILITGAAGFIGQRLAAALIKRGNLMRGDVSQAIAGIDLCDLAAPPAMDAPFPVQVVTGDLGDPDFAASLVDAQYDSIFHLASLLTLVAEQDSARAFAVNVDALRRMIEGAMNRPRILFTSSIAVFGGVLPDVVDETVPPGPATTYGSHKAINELLLADASRKGQVDGRSLRLPIVLTRPCPSGSDAGAVSDMVAGIIREPLAGGDISVPIRADTPLTVASARAVVNGLIALHELPASDLPAGRAIHLPALTVTPAEMIKSGLARGAKGAVEFRPDPQVQAVVDGWPDCFSSVHAGALGITGDADFDAVLSDHLDSGKGGQP